MVSLSSDGAAAIIGKEKGLVKRIRDKNAGLISYQFIIHQTVLCGKLSTTLKEVMDSLVKLINFMRSRSALQHRQFKEFLSECQVIEHFWQIKEQVTFFLQNLDTQEARNHLDFLTNECNMLAVAFLKDILKYLNVLNTELQGNGKLICDRIQSVSAFRRKLDIFEKDIAYPEFILFPTILKYKKNFEEDIAVFLKFISDLGKKFAARFQDFAETGKLSQFLKSPDEVAAAAEWTNVAAKLFGHSKPLLQMKIIDLEEDISLQMYKTASTEEFWGKHVSEKFDNCKKLAINLGNLAKKVAEYLKKCVYVYDLIGKFDGATTVMVEGIRVLKVGEKYAVLSQSARFAFLPLPQSANTYLQYADFQTVRDEIGLAVTVNSEHIEDMDARQDEEMNHVCR
ncbi:hypothetical protein CBL_10595 [Carabus blaptoides fortunei]